MDTAHFAMIDGDTWAEKFQFAVACRCCDRHKTNKPTHLAPCVELPFHDTKLKTDDCSCSCRHDARFMCRMFDTVECPKHSTWKNTDKDKGEHNENAKVINSDSEDDE